MSEQGASDGAADEPALTDLTSDRLRITAELSGRDGGTDPFVAAVRATRMPMIITDPRQADNPVVFANDSFCRLSGYPRGEILGRNCRFLQGPDTDPATVTRVREAVSAGRSIQIDIRNYRKTGEPFWNRLLIGPVKDAAGDLAYFFASQVDVTIERERLEGLESDNAALAAELGDRRRTQKADETRLRIATEAGRLGVWELDLTTRLLTSSAICKTNYGRDQADAFTYDDLLAAVHPDDHERMVAAVARSIATGAAYAIEYRIVKPDGAVGWVEARAQVLSSPGGEAERMVGTSVDITERKSAERRTQALVELGERFHTIEEPSELAFVAAEVLGRTLEVSRAGYGTIDPVAETITVERDWNAPGIHTIAGTLQFRDYGSYIEDLKRGETVVLADADKDPRTMATAGALKAISAQAFVNMPINEQQSFVALLYLNHATAREWTAEELVFLREVASRTRMAVERRRAERHLHALATSLEAQVAARTEALMEAEAALRQSQKMEAVGQLTGGLAHDFNNLLTGITGSLELMSNRLAQGRYTDLERYIGAAQGAAQRAASLTHRLLAFSRRQTLDPKPIDVNRLVADMEDLVRRTVGPSIAVEVVSAAGLWSTLIDPPQLENALLNLCINARDAMPEGGRLTIETANRWLDQSIARERDLPAGQYISLCVTDTGSGMTPETIARAFDPFFTTKPLGQGTGLGLSMVYGFARQSGGQVRIYSELGQGTTMCLYLPRHSGAGGAHAEAGADRTDDPRVAEPTQAGETVLVVDDEPTVRMLVADVLKGLGYETVEAADAASGLKMLRTDMRVDLLVTDVGLPGGMNGRQLADAGRMLRPGLKVLFITGYAENATIGDGRLERGMHILTKPFPMEVLSRRVQDILG